MQNPSRISAEVKQKNRSQILQGGRRTAKKAVSVLCAVLLACGLWPVFALADEQAAEQAAEQTVDELVQPQALANTYGSPDSAKLVIDAIGKKISSSGTKLPDNATTDVLQDGYLSLVGPYQFNATGNTNVRGKFDAAIGQAVHSSRVTNEEALVGYKMDNMNVAGTSRVIGGTTTAGRANVNSSSARLVDPQSSDVTIHKAYLVVAASQNVAMANSASVCPLAHYGVSFMGPSGVVSRYFPEVVYTDDSQQRASCFFDVTDLVKREGYGWYTAINIPAAARDESNSYGGDYFGSWKLVVVEENTAVAPRMLRLKLGGTTVKNGGDCSVSISGEGLSVVGDPAGELVIAMDGSDFGDSNQNLQYSTKKAGAAGIAGNIANTAKLRSAQKFFNLRVDNRDYLTDADFDPAPKQSNNSALSGLNGGANISLHNTDLTVMDVEKNGEAGNPAGLVLDGGETEVVLQAVTNLNPTTLTVLGLALEIVTPDFKTSLSIANLTKHYATSDQGYTVSPTSDFYADDGDDLRAVMLCENTSPETKQYLGLSDPVAKVTVNGFSSVDKNSVKAYFRATNGETYRMANVKVSENTDGSFTVEAEGFEEDSAGDSVVITTQGYFEISFNGKARGTKDFTQYSNRASIQGNFVDEQDNHHNFLLTNLGLQTVQTASNAKKYSVTVSGVGRGSGTVTGTGNYYGEDVAPIVWQADEGSTVSAVFVDSQVRDDLVEDAAARAATGTLSLPIENQDHEVVVVFDKDDEEENPLPPETDEDGTITYAVTTITDGGIQEITPSMSVKEGSDAEVTWTTKPGYKVVSVLVDGVAIAATDSGSVSFSDIAHAHQVQVLTERISSGQSGVPYVRTSLAGEGQITPSSTVVKGSSYDVTFKAKTDTAVLSKVLINGVEVFNEYWHNPKTGSKENEAFVSTYKTDESGVYTIPLKNITQDQSVEVVYRSTAPSGTGDINTYPTDLTVSTSLSGGIGTITPAQNVADGATNVSVVCTPQKGSKVEQIYLVRGSARQPVPSDWIITHEDGSVEVVLPSVDANCTVHAVLSMDPNDPDNPVPPTTTNKKYSITTSIVGGSGATISATQVNIPHGENRTITWKADQDKRIISVMIDGALRDDLLNPRGGSYTFTSIAANHDVVIQVAEKGTNDPSGSDPNDPNDPDNKKPTPDQDDYYVFIDAVAKGPGTVGPSASVPLDKNGKATVSWEPNPGARVVEVWVDGVKRNDLLNANSVSFAGILRDHNVTVVFGTPQDPDDPQCEIIVPDYDDENLFSTISTKLVGGKGSVTGTQVVSKTDTNPHKVMWSADKDYKVVSVTIDGVVYTAKDNPDIVGKGMWVFDDFASNHSVEVRLAFTGEIKPPTGSGNEKPTPTPDDRDPVYIDTDITIDPEDGVLTKEDIIDLIEDILGDDPRIPQGVDPEVKIYKNGEEVDVIDKSVPGEYIIEVTYLDKDGNPVVVRIRYSVSGTQGGLGNNDVMDGVGGLGTGDISGEVVSGEGAKGSMIRLARTADPLTNAVSACAGLAVVAGAVLLISTRVRSKRS